MHFFLQFFLTAIDAEQDFEVREQVIDRRAGIGKFSIDTILSVEDAVGSDAMLRQAQLPYPFLKEGTPLGEFGFPVRRAGARFRREPAKRAKA